VRILRSERQFFPDRITYNFVIREELALAAEDAHPDVAGSLRNVGELLEVEGIHFIAKALGITAMLLLGARAKEDNYDFRCVDQGVVNPEGRQAAITLLVYENHYYLLSTTLS